MIVSLPMMSGGEPGLSFFLVVFGLALLFGFAVGSINPATILARLRGQTLADQGSGNPGATNAGRVLGRGWGVLVGVLDVLKGYLPVLWVMGATDSWTAAWTALGVVLGHMFSPWLRFRGGKGVATAAGALLAFEPVLALLLAVVVLAAASMSRQVAIGSMIAATVLVVVGAWQWSQGMGYAWWMAAVGALVLVRHRRNVARLLGR